MFLDAGGVIVLPRSDLVRAALVKAGLTCDERDVAPAHYRAVRELDRRADGSGAEGYVPALCDALGVPAAEMPAAVAALSRIADRDGSGEILWSEPAPHAMQTISDLTRAGVPVVVVTNSDGHAAENLRDAGICQTTRGSGATVAAVIDSGVVGAAKPDPAMFRAALEQVEVSPGAAVHVGDMVTTDVIGARAAGIVPIHLDPYRRCRARDHRHIRSLKGMWRHCELTQTARRATQVHRAR